jgi:hypothetical protein
MQSAISFNVCWGRSVKECLLYSPRRTYVTATGMSALCQITDIASSLRLERMRVICDDIAIWIMMRKELSK